MPGSLAITVSSHLIVNFRSREGMAIAIYTTPNALSTTRIIGLYYYGIYRLSHVKSPISFLFTRIPYREQARLRASERYGIKNS